jgi:hypothetical protein
MFYPGDLFLRSQIILQNVPWNNGDWSNATLVRNFLVFLWLLANVSLSFRPNITENDLMAYFRMGRKKVQKYAVFHRKKNNFPSCPIVRKVHSAWRVETGVS